LSEPVAWKRANAGDLGATIVVDPASDDLKAVVKDVSTIGADVVIECAGTLATARLALELARRGGTVELFGVCPIGQTVPLEPNAVYFNELTIVGSYVNPYTFDRAIAALRGGLVQVKPMKIAQFSLEGVSEALSSLREGRTLKNMIVPGL
jgi:threonine dehydrogenase-like Zn-dependent dehydrogenase